MSELLAVFIWVTIAGLAFVAGLVGVAVTRRRLARLDQPVVATTSARVVEVPQATAGAQPAAA